MKLGREGFSFDKILLQTIADNICICIYLNPVILVVFLLTELFAVGYQVSDKRPLGLLFQCQLSANVRTKAFWLSINFYHIFTYLVFICLYTMKILHIKFTHDLRNMHALLIFEFATIQVGWAW